MPFDKTMENQNQKHYQINTKNINSNQYFINNTQKLAPTKNITNNKNELRDSNRSSFKPTIQEDEFSFTSRTKNDFNKRFNDPKASDSDDLYYLQDSVHDFGERVKKLDDYLSSLEKHFFIYNNDIEKNNESINVDFKEKTTKLTNTNSNMEENLIDYLKPILK